MAIQMKLNELIAANANTSNRLISIEDLTDEELEHVKQYYLHLSKISKKAKNLFETHSIDEAQKRSEMKYPGVSGSNGNAKRNDKKK